MGRSSQPAQKRFPFQPLSDEVLPCLGRRAIFGHVMHCIFPPPTGYQTPLACQFSRHFCGYSSNNASANCFASKGCKSSACSRNLTGTPRADGRRSQRLFAVPDRGFRKSPGNPQRESATRHGSSVLATGRTWVGFQFRQPGENAVFNFIGQPFQLFPRRAGKDDGMLHFRRAARALR